VGRQAGTRRVAGWGGGSETMRSESEQARGEGSKATAQHSASSRTCARTYVVEAILVRPREVRSDRGMRKLRTGTAQAQGTAGGGAARGAGQKNAGAAVSMRTAPLAGVGISSRPFVSLHIGGWVQPLLRPLTAATA